MTTNVPAPTRAVSPMENRTLKSSACLVLNWRPPPHCSARLALLLTGKTARHYSEKKTAMRFSPIEP
jgi:hypothetical protein